MPTRVAINGFGRIGRSFVRSAYERGADLEIVAVNDIADPATLAHLFTYDSVYGQFPAPVTCEGDVIAFDGREIRVLSERAPGDLPWADLGVDVVVESTGRFRTRADAEQHLKAGASKVILSAPSKGSEPVDANVVLGVNFHEVYDPAVHHIITNASCTTNCLAPVAKVLHEVVGHPPRPDDDRARLHRGPEPARRPAQGPAARPCRGHQPRAHEHRRRAGGRARHPRARGPPERHRRARPDPDGLARRPHDRGRPRDQRRGDRRRVPRSAPTAGT